MKNIKVLLLYPPEQSWPGTMVKPNGSLAYPYLGGALRDIGVETYVCDACIGDDNDDLHGNRIAIIQHLHKVESEVKVSSLCFYNCQSS